MTGNYLDAKREFDSLSGQSNAILEAEILKYAMGKNLVNSRIAGNILLREPTVQQALGKITYEARVIGICIEKVLERNVWTKHDRKDAKGHYKEYTLP